MDQFNMSMPGEPQIGLPGNHIVERIKQEAGIEMQLGPLAVIGISAGLNFLGGMSARSSAKKQKNAENAFYKKKLDEYDMPSWLMQGDKLRADVAFMTEGVKLKAANEKKFAAFQDKNNLRAYHQQLKIRTFQHEQKKKLYQKSEHLYGQSVQQAQEQAAIQMQETKQSFAFQNEDRIIESIQRKGELAATSQAGRSAVKAAQAELYDQGRQVAIMTESLISADRNTRMGLRDFLRKADAQRMLRPEIGPEPLKPLKTPLHDYQLPRALEDFDFGVAPMQGVSFTPVPSMGSVLAGAASAGFSAYAAATPGTNSFDINKVNNTVPLKSPTSGYGDLTFGINSNTPSLGYGSP